MGLVALQFPTVRDFIVAAQSLEVVAAAGWQEGDGEGTMRAEKRKEPASFTRRPPFPKRERKNILVSSERREEILDQRVH
jgi:hypothetical protein